MTPSPDSDQVRDGPTRVLTPRVSPLARSGVYAIIAWSIIATYNGPAANMAVDDARLSLCAFAILAALRP